MVLDAEQLDRLPDCFHDIVVIDRHVRANQVVDIELLRQRRTARRFAEIATRSAPAWG